MKPITPQSQREYLAANGFKVGQRGRFSKEMVQALKDSGLVFTKPINDLEPRSKVGSTPLA